jgi:hypothetical protein
VKPRASTAHVHYGPAVPGFHDSTIRFPLEARDGYTSTSTYTTPASSHRASNAAWERMWLACGSPSSVAMPRPDLRTSLNQCSCCARRDAHVDSWILLRQLWLKPEICCGQQTPPVQGCISPLPFRFRFMHVPNGGRGKPGGRA